MSKKPPTLPFQPLPEPPPSGADYVKIGDNEGFAFVDTSGNLVTLDSDQLGSNQVDLRPATPEEIEGARKGFAAQGGGQKALGLLETAASGATFGLSGGLLDTPESAARQQVLEKQNPMLLGGARVLGTLAPTMVGAGVVGGAARALGAGAKLAGAAAFAGETVAQSAAYELSEASQQDRDVEVGNIAQGMLEGAAFLGLGHGLLAAGRKGLKALRGAEQGAEAAADVAQAATADSTIARAKAGAATREAAERSIPSRKEAVSYGQNKAQVHQEVNDLGYQAGNNAFGRDGSFQKANNISFKKPDIAGKMTDADLGAIDEVTLDYAERLEDLANRIEDPNHTSAPSKAAARSIRAQAKRIRQARAGVQLEATGLSSGYVEDAAIVTDQAKRHLDDLREQFGSGATKGTDPNRNNARMIQELLDGEGGIRKGLEDSSVWGKTWAEKQAGENALWTGRKGIIENRDYWQGELMRRPPGAAGKERAGFNTVPVKEMEGDMVERILKLDPNRRRAVLEAIDNDIQASRKLTQIKQEIGGTEARQALSDFQRDLTHWQEAVDEVKRIQKINDVHGAYLKKAEKLGEIGLEDALEKVPGVGHVGGVAVRGVKKLLNERFTDVGADLSKARSIDDLRASIAKRAGKPEPVRARVEPTTAPTEAAPPRKANEPEVSPAARQRLRQRQKQSGHVVISGAREIPLNDVRVPDAEGYLEPASLQKLKRHAAEIRASAETAVAGKSLEDLRALPLDDGPGAADSRAKVEAFKQDKTFRDTGMLPSNNDRGRGGLPALSHYPGEGWSLQNGRHRLTAAAESGQEYIVAHLKKYNKKGDVVWDYVGPVRVGKPKIAAGGERGFADLAGGIAKSPMGVVTAAGGGYAAIKHLASMKAETEAIKEIDEHSKSTTERAMLALASPDVKLAPLPPMAERFQGEYPTLTEAYNARIGQMRQLAEDPAKLINQVTAAFQPLAEAGHPELAAKLITRLNVGIQYLLANQPPALATSMFEPDGSPVDEVAVLQFAPIWEAVWKPLDTVRDIGTRDASPSAVQALKEIHPDVYTRTMAEAFKTLAQAGPSVDFETKRYLDNVFEFGAAVGRSFSPKMSNLLAQERAKQQSPVQQSLGGENFVGPTSATQMFSKGPSALQGG